MTDAAANRIVAHNVSKAFEKRRGGENLAIGDLNIEIKEGEFIALIGPSGCGKSTFLYMVAGFVFPDRGTVEIDGKRVVGPGANRGLVFQEYTLFPWRTVEGNVRFGLDIAKRKGPETTARCEELIRLVGLSGFQDAYPHELSGGMQQRTAIARALAYDPAILLMDEPFGALDAQTKRRLIDDVTKIWQATGKTILFVTHSVEEALLLSDRVILLGARPSSVVREIRVDMPRPRQVHDPCFVELQRELLDCLDSEVAKMMPETV
jgi:NitT/TauT family transport system ATP-binding protein